MGQAVSDIIDYAENPEKTNNGKLISSYQCDSRIADAEFLFSKRQYLARTGRQRGADDVIAYQIRQSFVPGEITPEEANRLGYELARRFTKGNHAFIVCTHVDKAHVHNHIIWNSTSLNYDGQIFPVPASSAGWIFHGAKPRFPPPTEAVAAHPGWRASVRGRHQSPCGAGPGGWYLTEHGLLDYADLTARADEATGHYHELSEKIKAAEKRMAEIAVLKTHIINYAKTRDTYTAYRKAGYSKKFKAEHESDILLHQAAKKFFDEAGLKKLPSVK